MTDRYTKAIEQLGSDKLDVRIGGIYALERVARDSAKDHPTVMEVLTAFIREHSREPWPPPDPGVQVGARSTRPDVQAAITVVGRRGRKHDIQPMDLGGANLGGANLGGADLSHAYLATAHLDGANLDGANLGGAYLGYADLTDADLTGATLGYATLTGAKLDSADLTRANLGGADLTRANLGGTELITDANLTGANLDGANLGGVNLTDARWPEDVPVPGGWKLNTDSGRLEKTATGAGPTETN